MSGTEKTGDKLVASIRKTKASAAKSEQPAPAKKTASPSRARSSTPAAKSKRTAQGKGDPYSCGGRVWPD